MIGVAMISRHRDNHVHAGETGNISFSSDHNEDGPYPNRIAYYVLVVAIAAVSLFGFYTILVILEEEF